jgi:pre-rRNA-processing protein TSR3
VKELRLGGHFPGVVLSPAGQCCISREDFTIIKTKGLAVVDCSWNKLDDVPFGVHRTVSREDPAGLHYSVVPQTY